MEWDGGRLCGNCKRRVSGGGSGVVGLRDMSRTRLNEKWQARRTVHEKKITGVRAAISTPPAENNLAIKRKGAGAFEL